MKLSIGSALVLLFSLFSIHAPAATGESLLSFLPQKVAAVNEVVEFTPKAGFHFNLKAPQVCGEGHLVSSAKNSVKCQFSASGPQAISLKICDDRESFCRPQDFTIMVAGQGHPPGSSSAESGVPAELLPGFLGDTASAQKAARKDHKLIFVDFFGIWCPPCNTMNETVLISPAFREATKDFVLVSLDTDRPSSWDWKSKYKITGFPTYLILDEKLNEIGRWSSDASLKVFLKWIKNQEGLRRQPVETAVQEWHRNKADEKTKIRLANWFIDQKETKEAEKVLTGLKSRGALFLMATAHLTDLEKDGASQSELSAALLAAIKSFDGSDGQPAEPDILAWLDKLAEVDRPTAQSELKRINLILEKLKVSSRLEELGDSWPDIVQMAAYLVDESGQKAEAKKLFSEAADAFAEQNPKGNSALLRGASLERAKCLAMAGRPKDAEPIYKALVEKYPKEYTFYYVYARFLYGQKRYPAAETEVNKAEPLAYGDNWLSVEELKAKILLEEKKKTEARTILQDTLEKVQLPADPNIWTHSRYKSLHALLDQIESH